MSGQAEQGAGHGATLSLPLMAAGAGMGVALLGTGLYLWSVHGAAIFTDMVSAALAWCM